MNLTAKLTDSELSALNARFADASASDVLRWAMEQYGDRLVVASSFGAEDVVLIDLAAKISKNVRVFTLDTGRLHQETYDVLEAVVDKYGIEVEVMSPDTVSLQELIRAKGPNSFYASVDNRKECCSVRKVEPLKRVLNTADAWVTGLRREQAVTRSEIQHFERDDSNGGMLKVNPVASWTHDEIWDHIHANNVPYNRLHDQGFPSIGCAPCTRAIEAGEDVRAGRWWWESPELKECGLHRRLQNAAAE
ncbi:MAG: phosphoadenosine phosphosulfate reductase [Bradymonadia bacterium]|jgi:phosphoadenosine phosphosulfate reductase